MADFHGFSQGQCSDRSLGKTTKTREYLSVFPRVICYWVGNLGIICLAPLNTGKPHANFRANRLLISTAWQTVTQIRPPLVSYYPSIIADLAKPPSYSAPYIAEYLFYLCTATGISGMDNLRRYECLIISVKYSVEPVKVLPELPCRIIAAWLPKF